MTWEWSEWANHVLAELKRFDSKLDVLTNQNAEQNLTLVRNTITLEDHVKRTNLLEAKVGKVEDNISSLDKHVEIILKLHEKVERTEKEVEALKAEISRVQSFVNMFKLTPGKIKYLTMLVGLISSTIALYHTIVKPYLHEQQLKQEMIIEKRVIGPIKPAR